MKTEHKRKIASILFVLISAICIAQPPPYGEDPEPLPVDGGILVCAFAALCYGVKKLLKNN